MDKRAIKPRVSKMNLAIVISTRSLYLGILRVHSNTPPDLKADFILANPPFNQKDWGIDLYKMMPVGNMEYHQMETPTMDG